MKVTTSKRKHFNMQVNGGGRPLWGGGVYPRQVYSNLIACEQMQMKDMPGGEFLWIKMGENTAGSRYEKHLERGEVNGTRDIHGGFTLNEDAPFDMKLVGMDAITGAMIFRVGRVLHTRAYRHEVQGRSRGDYTEYYNQHTQAWRNGTRGGYMCLKTYDGEARDWMELKPRPEDKPYS